LTEGNIRDIAVQLVKALTANDEQGTVTAVRQLGTQFLVDVNRTANALEKLCKLVEDM
jgi:hypothetical protein